jgi:outer membrane protein assembly factor BamB
MKYPAFISVAHEETPRFDVDISPFADVEVQFAFDLAREMKKRLVLDIGIGGSIVSTAAIHNDVLYFGCADKNFYAVTTKGKELWRFGTEAQVLSTPRIGNGKIYFGSFDGNFYALSLEGRLAWRFKTDDKISGSPCIHEKNVYIGSNDGNLYCLNAQNGKEIWRYSTNGAIVSGVVYNNNRLYFGSDDMNFYSIDARNGKLLWKFPTKGSALLYAFREYPIYKNIVYFNSYDFNLYAIDFDGSLVWNLGMDDHIYSVSVYGDRVFVGSRDGNLHCLDARTGRGIWRFQTMGYVVSQVLVLEDKLYFGSTDGNIYCTDFNGNRLWSLSTGGPINPSPVTDGKAIYIGSWDCNFYAVSLDGKLLWKFPTSLSYQSPIDIKQEGSNKVLKSFYLDRGSSEKRAYKEGIPVINTDYGSMDESYQSLGIDVKYLMGHDKAYKTKKKYR